MSVHCLTLAADKHYYPAAKRVYQASDGVRIIGLTCCKTISVTGFAERFESPVVVRDRGHKACCEHDRQYPPGERRAACDCNVDQIHRDLHGQHGDE